MQRFSATLIVLVMLALLAPVVAADDAGARRPVVVVLAGRFAITGDRGAGTVPIHVSRDWDVPQPDVTRAIVMIHGWSRRDALVGDLAATRAGAAARDTIVIAPQFLTQADIDAHALPSDILRWGLDDWKAGYAARNPAPVSSFDVVDAILARLAKPQTFPDLHIVVIAGHSAGGQFVQRYAAVGRGQTPLLERNIRVRYVVANPSSYVYFTAARPAASAGAAVACPRLNEWQYGFDGRLPGYVAQPVDPTALENAYIARDVVYLLGTADTDPNQSELDRSCAGEAEGATRFARGLNYVTALIARHSDALNQRLFEVPGIGHHSDQMFTSTCGLAALFDTGGCAQTPIPRGGGS